MIKKNKNEIPKNRCTLVVGFGGTGGQIAQNLAKLLAIDPTVARVYLSRTYFLLVDTDTGDLDKNRSELLETGSKAGFERYEDHVKTFCLAEGIDSFTNYVLSFDNVWRDSAAIDRLRDVLWISNSGRPFTASRLAAAPTDGAAQCAMISAFMSQASIGQADQGFDQKVREVIKSASEGNEGCQFQILIGNSFSGGTGRGSWAILTLRIKHILSHFGIEHSQISGFFLDQSCFKSVYEANPLQREPMQINSLTGFSELAAWISLAISEHSEPDAKSPILRIPSLRNPLDEASDVINTEALAAPDGQSFGEFRTGRWPLRRAYVITDHSDGAQFEKADCENLAASGMMSLIAFPSITSKLNNETSYFGSTALSKAYVPIGAIRRYLELFVKEEALSETLLAEDKELSKRVDRFVKEYIELCPKPSTAGEEPYRVAISRAHQSVLTGTGQGGANATATQRSLLERIVFAAANHEGKSKRFSDAADFVKSNPSEFVKPSSEIIEKMKEETGYFSVVFEASRTEAQLYSRAVLGSSLSGTDQEKAIANHVRTMLFKLADTVGREKGEKGGLRVLSGCLKDVLARVIRAEQEKFDYDEQRLGSELAALRVKSVFGLRSTFDSSRVQVALTDGSYAMLAAAIAKRHVRVMKQLRLLLEAVEARIAIALDVVEKIRTEKRQDASGAAKDAILPVRQEEPYSSRQEQLEKVFGEKRGTFKRMNIVLKPICKNGDIKAGRPALDRYLQRGDYHKVMGDAYKEIVGYVFDGVTGSNGATDASATKAWVRGQVEKQLKMVGLPSVDEADTALIEEFGVARVLSDYAKEFVQLHGEWGEQTARDNIARVFEDVFGYSITEQNSDGEPPGMDKQVARFAFKLAERNDEPVIVTQGRNGIRSPDRVTLMLPSSFSEDEKASINRERDMYRDLSGPRRAAQYAIPEFEVEWKSPTPFALFASTFVWIPTEEFKKRQLCAWRSFDYWQNQELAGRWFDALDDETGDSVFHAPAQAVGVGYTFPFFIRRPEFRDRLWRPWRGRSQLTMDDRRRATAFLWLLLGKGVSSNQIDVTAGVERIVEKLSTARREMLEKQVNVRRDDWSSRFKFVSSESKMSVLADFSQGLLLSKGNRDLEEPVVVSDYLPFKPSDGAELRGHITADVIFANWFKSAQAQSGSAVGKLIDRVLTDRRTVLGHLKSRGLDFDDFAPSWVAIALQDYVDGVSSELEKQSEYINSRSARSRRDAFFLKLKKCLEGEHKVNLLDPTEPRGA